jgi:hypothetical protein
MIQKAKKRTLFLIGIIITSLAGVVGAHIRSSYSRDESLIMSSLASPVYADACPTCTWMGDSGGCSGGDSSAGGDY